MELKMVVGGKYELEEVVAQGEESRTYAAREVSSGRAMLVHQLLEQLPGSQRPSLKELAERYGPIVEICSSEGVDYVVTEAPPRGTGDDRLTRVGAWRVSAGLATPPAPSEPGEFTRMFQAPASTPSPRPAAPPAAEQPGEFTRYFQSSLGSSRIEESKTPAPAPPAVPPAAAARPPGEYTRLFQTPAPPAAPPSPGSGATHVFVTPSAPSPQTPVQIQEGPSEFTRIIQASPQAPAEVRPPEPPRPAAALPATGKPGVPVMLIILFASLAVLAIAMILYFALRH